MTHDVSEIADHLASNPDGLDIPALIAQARQMWPTATDVDIGQAARLGAQRAERAAQACFAEAEALDDLYVARRRQSLTVVDGGRS